VAAAARRVRQAQRRLLDCRSTEEALEAAREEARALRSLDRALAELSLTEGAEPKARSAGA
jgi:hypothetical protein